MSRYVPNPDCDCRLCYHADKADQYTKNGQIYCRARKMNVDFELCNECGTECDDIDINPELLKVDHLLRQGNEYARTGGASVFL